MYIKSMVLDGFKSYGTRVEINDFDREFNAITGLNGTGKSNILDGICFVLGIQLKHVRANTMQELIYKNGQAGITKASVTLVFDNSDKNNTPIGYENDNQIVICRQIAVGVSTPRYMINGSTVPPKRVTDLFSSVNLNVNNPHFLIMQGRVTKVLSMKPHETLGMLEEAAGTGMYEAKKIAAQKLMAKKEDKLKSLNSMLKEEIAPKIEKLKGEKEKYLELQKVTREAEHWGKIYTAFSYWTLLQKMTKGEEDRNKKIVELEKGQQSMVEKEKQIEAVEQLMKDIQLAMDEEAAGKLKGTEEKLATERKNEALICAKYQSEKDSINAEEKKLAQLIRSVQDDKAALKKKETEMKDMDRKYEKLKIEDEKDKEAYVAAQHKFQAISAGLFAAEDGSVGTLQDQIIAMKSQISTAETECKQCEMQLSHVKTKIPEKRKLMNQTESDSTKDKQTLETKRKELNKLNQDLDRLKYEEGAFERLNEERQNLIREKNNAQGQVYNLNNRDRNMEFTFTDPEPNFDRSRVKGRVARLVTVKDPKYALAIETALGGYVFHVVVDNEHTSKLLIQNGNLSRRTTFIPLTKIRANVMDGRIIKTAQNLVGKDNVFPALSLISYKPEYQKAMEFLLGNVFIATSGDVAKRVTFNPEVRKKSITLDGEVYDHSGVLSGGSKVTTAGILGRVQALMEVERGFESSAASLSALEKQLASLERIYSQWSQVKHSRDLAAHEFARLEERLQKTTFFSHKQEYEELINKQAELEQKIKECKKVVKENTEKVKEKESNMNNIEGLRERELENAKKEMKRLKEKADKSGDVWKQKEQEYETHKLEINDLQKAIEKGEENVESFREELNKVKTEVDKLDGDTRNVKERVRILEADIKVQKDVLNEKNAEIQKHKKTKDKCLAEIKKLTNQVTDIQAELKNVEKESESIQERISQLEDDHTWINSEKENFGNPDSLYDFEKMNPHAVTQKYKNLKETRDKLERTVDKKAQMSLKNEEALFTDTLTKKKIVENDRQKLLQVIEELDEKKKVALRDAWQKVNVDFGSIFSLLLPGSQAKLTPLPGKDILDGLVVNIAFGGLWKESLGELSGGQRSLVALSLILAMLLFKPAPLYILDEVDAALDLSHTQNIGVMLKRHFKTSQFIIVSLKEGMFSNANVIFRTKFVDGNSAVTRTVNRRQ